MVKGLTITTMIGPGRRQGGVTCTPVSITYLDGRVTLTESMAEAARVTGSKVETIRNRLQPSIHKDYLPGYRNQADVPGYNSYRQARKRCNWPGHHKYNDYGGRGILFLFKNFREFITEVGIRPGIEYTIDRIDNDGNYEPGNVRWATPTQQSSNRRSRRKTTTQV